MWSRDTISPRRGRATKQKPPDSQRRPGVRFCPDGTDRMRAGEDAGRTAAASDHAGSQSPAQACGASPGHSRLHRWRPGAADGGAGWYQPADGLALAAALCRRGRGRPAARQDRASPASHRSRPGDGEGRRHLAALGATHLGDTRSATASRPHVQAVA